MADLVPGKIIAILVFLIGTLICTYAPFIFKGLRKSPGALSIINTFGGGLFLAGGVIHILPEALHKMEAWYKVDPHAGHGHRLRSLVSHIEAEPEEEEEVERFPWPAFAASLIFCVQLILEKTAGRNANASWLFAAGMGLHAVFAGLALGLQKTTGAFMALMLGIIAHKFSECIAVGVKIFENVQPGKLQKYSDVGKSAQTIENRSPAQVNLNSNEEEKEENKVVPVEDENKIEEHKIAEMQEEVKVVEEQDSPVQARETVATHSNYFFP